MYRLTGRVDRFYIFIHLFLAVALAGLTVLAVYPHVVSEGFTAELVGIMLVPLSVIGFLVWSMFN